MSRLGLRTAARGEGVGGPGPSGRSPGGWWWWLALLLMAAGVALGYAGFKELPGDASDDDDLYAAFKLLVLDGPNGGGSDKLEVARWVAPLGTTLAAIRALIAVFRSQVDEFLAWMYRDHVIVAGLGDYGTHLALSFRRENRQVVGVDRDLAPGAARALRDEEVRVVSGDVTGERLMKRLGVRRAAYLVVTCGQDSLNAEIAERARALVRQPDGPLPKLLHWRRSSEALTALVHVDDLRLWPQLKARALSIRETAPMRTEFFNVAESGARILVSEHPLPRPAGAVPRVLVVGVGALGEQVLLHLALEWNRNRNRTGNPTAANQRIEMIAVAPDAKARVDALCKRHPRLADVAHVVAHDADVDLPSPDDREPVERGAVDKVYVCTEQDEDGVAAALALHAPARRQRIPIVLVLRDDTRGLALSLTSPGGSLPGVAVFGLLSRTLPPALLERGTNEIIAQAAHAHYLEREREKGVGPGVNRAAVEWRDLHPNWKQSNRAFADRVGAKLAEADCVLVPDPFASAADGEFRFTSDEIERLARIEHEQWCENLVRQGWRRGQEKDEERKTHPLLKPWIELPEEERDKDRAPMEALPRLVADAGFVIVRARPLRS